MDELQESAEKEKQVLIREAETAKQQLDNNKEKTDLSDRELRSMNEDLADFIQRQIGL
jgi:hypothetical protein